LKRNTFASYKNIYVIEELNESCSNDDTYNKSNTSNDEFNDFDMGQSLKPNELSNSWFTLKKFTTYDYLTEIMTKCGACLTSRVALAELIVAIDKTNDYNTETSSGRMQLEKDRNIFRECAIELRKKLRSKQSGIQIVSSDWIIGKKN